jgi:protein SCO1
MKKAAYGVVALVALLALGAVAWQWLRPPELHGTVLQAPERAADFTLVGSDGQPVRLSDFAGKWTLLYFGYTFCPDICPTTMADLRAARAALGNRAGNVQVVLISVDPERDTPETVGRYATAFDPTFVGLTGTPEQIAAAATPFGVYYAKEGETGAGSYLVSHTSTIMVVDPEGYLRYVIPYGVGGEAIASDLRYLMR